MDNRPFYKTLKFWLVFALALLLVLCGVTAAFGPVAILKVLLEPSFWLAVTAAAGVVGATLTAIVRAFAPVWDELRKIRGEAETAKDEAVIAKGEAVLAKSKAVTAEAVVKEINIKAEDNSERATLLETRYEALSKQYVRINSMAERLADNLQEQQDKSDTKIAQLTDQLERVTQQNTDRRIEIAQLKEDHRAEITELKETHRTEIAELREQIREMGRTNTADKLEINTLQARAKQLEGRVEELEGQVKKLEGENTRLQEENRDLKNNPRRRSTDELTLPGGITSGDTVKIERID